MKKLDFAALLLIFFGMQMNVQAQFPPSYVVYGNQTADFLGAYVITLDDVNGDGFDDFASSTANAVSGTGIIQAGFAAVYSGIDGTVIWSMTGANTSDRVGELLANAGDVNADGIADIILSNREGSNIGTIKVLSGNDGTELHSFPGFDLMTGTGHQAGPAGDVNGDGFDDFMIGRYSENSNGSNSGMARVHSGLDGSVIHFFLGSASSEGLGWNTIGVGDLNGDGFDDFAITSVNFGIFNESSNAVTNIHSGADASILFTFPGGDYFGSIAPAGDVNNDGTPDVIVGNPRAGFNGTWSGAALIYSGFDGSMLQQVTGDLPNDRLGAAVSGVGDVDGDGVDDFAAASPVADINGTDTGVVRVYSGLTNSLIHEFSGSTSIDQFGIDIAGGHDLNNDGTPDLVVGAQTDDGVFVDTGAAHVFFLPGPPTPGLGQPNSQFARLEVNQTPTGTTKGPFFSTITRGQYFTLDFSGAPLALFEVYSSVVLNPGGWDFGPFGLFDLGTGPTFSDVSILFAGFGTVFPQYALDFAGHAQMSFFVHPFLQVGPSISIQGLIQNPQPWVNGHWATLTAAHQFVIQ